MTQNQIHIYCPVLDNHGVDQEYPQNVRVILAYHGIDAYTEVQTFGVWQGKSERVIRFEILTTLGKVCADAIARDVRGALIGQDAILVTYTPNAVESILL